MEPKMTSKQWVNHLFGNKVRILKPYGWDSNEEYNDVLITRSQFIQKMLNSVFQGEEEALAQVIDLEDVEW